VIREFIRRGVIVRTVINGLTFDGATKDPMQMAVRDAQGQRRELPRAQAELQPRTACHGAGPARPERQRDPDREGHEPQPANGVSHQG